MKIGKHLAALSVWHEQRMPGDLGGLVPWEEWTILPTGGGQLEKGPLKNGVQSRGSVAFIQGCTVYSLSGKCPSTPVWTLQQAGWSSLPKGLQYMVKVTDSMKVQEPGRNIHEWRRSMQVQRKLGVIWKSQVLSKGNSLHPDGIRGSALLNLWNFQTIQKASRLKSCTIPWSLRVGN